jgi:hypothetical protein
MWPVFDYVRILRSGNYVISVTHEIADSVVIDIWYYVCNI